MTDVEDVSTETQLGVGGNPTEAAIKNVVDGEVDDIDDRVGISVVVIISGVKHFYHYGNTVAGSGLVPNDDTLYAIGSLTKTFTGTMLSKLHWDNRVDWHDLLTDHITQDLPPGRELITLRHLGLHEANLTKDAPGSNASHATGSFTGDMNKVKESLRTCSATFPCAPPFGDNVEHRYSNWGYYVLSVVLAEAMGTNIPTMFKKDIFAPLGMSSTGYKWELVETSCLAANTHCTYTDYGNCTYVAACHNSFNHRVAPGYHNADGDPVLGGDGQGSDDAAAVGSGLLWSTPKDMAKWLAFQMNADGTNTANEERYLASAQLPRTVDNGSFFSDHGETPGGTEYLIKSGTIDSQFKSGLAFTADREVGVVVLSNLDSVRAKDLAYDILVGLVD